MAVDAGLVAWVEEAMAPVGSVTRRAMMGGMTFYCDGIVFAIAAEAELWFKGDAVSASEWDAAGCARFSFTRSDGTTAAMNYRRAPDDVYDDAEAFRRWAALALAAGQRAPRKAKGAAPRARRPAAAPPTRR